MWTQTNIQPYGQPQVYLVQGSCTWQPWIKKCKLKPSSQSQPTKIKFMIRVWMKLLWEKCRLKIEIPPILMTFMHEPSIMWIIRDKRSRKRKV